MKKFDVVDIGIIVADIPIQVPGKVLDFTQDTIRLETIRILPGGDAANSAVALSGLGKKVALAGALGDDAMGRLVREEIRSRGVDTHYVRMKKGVQTSASVVIINGAGERTFVCARGNNETLCVQDLDELLIENTRHINLSSLFAHPSFEKEGGPAFFENAKNAGVTISADAGHDNYNTGFFGVVELLRYVDIFMPSYAEAKYMSGESEPGRMARFFADEIGEKIIVIKLGAEGCYVRETGREYALPAFRTDAVDTTGAGDNFLAGFICAYLDGAGAEECARFASAAAAISVTQVGATSPLVTVENAVELMETQSGEIIF